jgi:hypothetical protein
MSGSMERRIQRFQFKVQQRVTLADEEITRLSLYQKNLEAEIADVRDQLRIFTNQTTQVRTQETGKEKRQQTHREAVLAQLRADHVRQVSELETTNEEEVASFQQEFEQALEDAEKWGEQHIATSSADLDRELERVNAAIDRERNTGLESALDPNESADMECLRQLLDFERTRIDGLEDRVKQLSQERLDKLNGLKERLGESLNTLEDLERAHCKRVEQFKSRSDAEDRAYQGKLAKLTEEQKKAITALSREHAALVQKVKGQEKVVQQLESQSETERDRADEEIARLRKDIDNALAESKCDDAEKQTNETLSSTMQNLQRTEQILTEKENDVLKLRMENESLKRDVARIRHEGLLAARRIGKVT